MGKGLTFLSIPLIVCSSWSAAFAGRVIHVDATATGANDGSSWVNAYRYLQDALADANSADKPVEIRVAQGVYRPDQGANVTSKDLSATFQLINSVTLRGGYAGLAWPDPNIRDAEKYETILSGDLAGDDVDVNEPSELLGLSVALDNSRTVVTGSGTERTAVLDGFTISGGQGYVPTVPTEGYYGGAGMRNVHGSPAVVDCRFTRNASRMGGGGMLNCSGSEPSVVNCRFGENYAYWGGGIGNVDSNAVISNCTFKANVDGGMYNMYSSPVVSDCTFEGNSSNSGGGMRNDYGQPVVTNCRFIGNIALVGGGMCNNGNINLTVTGCVFRGNVVSHGGGGVSNGDRNKSTFTNCVFSENRAWEGGGMYNVRSSYSRVTLTGCTFSDNSVQDYGGGIYLSSNAILLGCSFRGNLASEGAGAYYYYNTCVFAECVFSGNYAKQYGGGVCVRNTRTTLTRCTFSGNVAQVDGGAIAAYDDGVVGGDGCIVWGNFPREIYFEVERPTLTYSDVRGGWQDEGDIGADPCFAEPGYWDPNGTPGDANDDFWIDGDYHLKSQAGRWEPKNRIWVKDNVTSPCIDAGNPHSPIGLEPFPNGGVLNIGNYGGTTEASKSYFGKPVCETIVAGDINGDCRVDWADMVIMASHWLEGRTATSGPGVIDHGGTELRDLLATIEGEAEEPPYISLTSDLYLRFIMAPPGTHFFVDPAMRGTPQEAAGWFLTRWRNLFVNDSPAVGFDIIRFTTSHAYTNILYQQTYASLEVFGAQMIVEVDATGGVGAVMSDIMRDTRALDTGQVPLNPGIDSSTAQKKAIELLAAQKPGLALEADLPTLLIFCPDVVGNAGQTQLVWKTVVGVTDGGPVRELVMVDAHSGNISFHYSLIPIR